MCRLNLLERRRYLLNVSVAGVIANAEIGNLRESFEFFDSFECRNLVGNVFDHYCDTSEGADLGDGCICVLECDWTELFFRIAEMEHNIREGNLIRQLERSFDLVKCDVTMTSLRF